MTTPSEIRLVSPAVDFVDNRLSDHYPAFADMPAHFDHTLDRYVAAQAGPEITILQDITVTSEPDTITTAGSSRPAPETPKAHAFPDIMVGFTRQYPLEPKGRVEKHCSIRGKCSWEEVLEVLESAGEAYMTNVGVKGKVRRAARFIGDKADVMKRVTSVVPDVDYSRPILGTLTFLLEVRGPSSLVHRVLVTWVNLPQNRHSSRRVKFEWRSRPAWKN